MPALAIRINFIGELLGFICVLVISLRRRFALFRLTAFPVFLLAIIVDENIFSEESKKNATKFLQSYLVPMSKISCILDLLFCFFKLAWVTITF